MTRYSPAMQALHWGMAALMFATLPLAWIMTSLPRKAPDREFWSTLHKSIGVTLLVLVAIRLMVRARRPVPAEMPGPGWMRIAARISHWSLYAMLIVMPVSGYVVSSAGGNAVSYFGLFDLPALAKDQALQGMARMVHDNARFAVYGLILLHISATVWHVVVRRDGILNRQLPAQR